MRLLKVKNRIGSIDDLSPRIDRLTPVFNSFNNFYITYMNSDLLNDDAYNKYLEYNLAIFTEFKPFKKLSR